MNAAEVETLVRNAAIKAQQDCDGFTLPIMCAWGAEHLLDTILADLKAIPTSSPNPPQTPETN